MLSTLYTYRKEFFYLCPILKYVMPYFERAHEVFEVFKRNTSHVSTVKCNYYLATNLDTSATFNVVCNYIEKSYVRFRMSKLLSKK